MPSPRSADHTVADATPTVVGSKVTYDVDRRLIEVGSPRIPVLAHLPLDDAVRRADIEGKAAWDLSPALRQSAEALVDRLLTTTQR